MQQLRPQDSPSYKHPDYQKMAGCLKVLLDVFNSLEEVKNQYLFKEKKEPEWAYMARVARAVFNNKLSPTLKSCAGLLTAFELTDTPASVTAVLENVDNCGSSYKSFFCDADIMALRDGFCYVLIDYPPVSVDQPLTAADRLTSNRRPYLSLIDRRNVLNWAWHYENGKKVIDSVVIQSSKEMPDGEFGSKIVTQYHQLKRVLTENGFKVEHRKWEIKSDGGKEVPVIVDQALTTLSEIPIVCYPYTSKPFNVDTPPFLKLARLNVKLFQKQSCLDEIEHRVNVPTVYRKHPTVDVPENSPPVVLGANYVIEIPMGGDVGVLELSGSGMADLRQSITGLLDQIDSEGLAFLAGSKVQKTATEAFLDSAQIQASLMGMARDKSSAIIRIFDFWTAYTGEKNTTKVAMDHSLLEMPLDAQEMGVLTNLWTQGAISHETLLELLKMGKQLPPNFDVEEELKRVDDERAAQVAAIPVNPLATAPDNSQPEQEAA